MSERNTSSSLEGHFTQPATHNDLHILVSFSPDNFEIVQEPPTLPKKRKLGQFARGEAPTDGKFLSLTERARARKNGIPYIDALMTLETETKEPSLRVPNRLGKLGILEQNPSQTKLEDSSQRNRLGSRLSTI